MTALSQSSAEARAIETLGSAPEFYIVDLRPEWRRNPYVTLWRPENKGYAYPTAWAGRYTRERVEAGRHCYTEKRGRLFIRFAAPCATVDAMGGPPDIEGRGRTDGNTGLVLRNTGAVRNALRRARYRPEWMRARSKADRPAPEPPGASEKEG